MSRRHRLPYQATARGPLGLPRSAFLIAGGLSSLLLFVWRPLHAQADGGAPLTITCEPTVDANAARPAADTSCGTAIGLPDSLQQLTLRFRVTGGMPPGSPAALVMFTASDGRVTPDTARVDKDGLVAVAWYRVKGNTPVAISAAVVTPAGTATRIVRLTPATPPPASAYRVQIASGGTQASYEKAAVRLPIVAEIQHDGKAGTEAVITDPALCSRFRVVFRPTSGGGAVTPDTSLAKYEKRRVYPSDTLAAAEHALTFQVDTSGRDQPRSQIRDGCFAVGYWTLGSGVGFQFVRAVLVPPEGSASKAPPVQYRGLARALPRLVAGYAALSQVDYSIFRAGQSRTIRVERPLPTGGTAAYDSSVVTSRDSLEEVTARRSVVVGLAFAPRPHWRWLTMTLGVGAQDPANDWYLGVSALRPFRKFLESEGLLFDAHLVLNAGRVEQVKDPVGCIQTTALCSEVEKKIYWFRGVGAMVSLDAGSLLTDALKKLVGG